MVSSLGREPTSRAASPTLALSLIGLFMDRGEILRPLGRVTSSSQCAWNIPRFSSGSPESWETLQAWDGWSPGHRP